MKKLAGLIGAAFTAGATPMVAVAQEYGPHGHPHAWGDGWGGMMLFGPLMMIVFLVVAVVLIVLAIRWALGSGHASGPPGRMSPLDVLKDRFARGEIDKQEYEERRRVLSD